MAPKKCSNTCDLFSAAMLKKTFQPTSGVDLPVTHEHLRELGFEPTDHTITLNKKVLKYNISPNQEHQQVPGVYLFTAATNRRASRSCVLYVGKARNGPAPRLTQHAAGYKRNNKSLGAKNRLQFLMAQLQIVEVNVWFKKSKDKRVNTILSVKCNQAPHISLYSLEEEAFIAYFAEIGEILINNSLPPNRRQSAEANLNRAPTCLTTITKQVKKNSREFLAFWKESVANWSDETKENFCTALKILDNHDVLAGRLAKVIGRYNKGPFRDQKVLVFGELNNVNFVRGTNQLMFTLDGKNLAAYPFDVRKITVSSVSEFIGR